MFTVAFGRKSLLARGLVPDLSLAHADGETLPAAAEVKLGFPIFFFYKYFTNSLAGEALDA